MYLERFDLYQLCVSYTLKKSGPLGFVYKIKQLKFWGQPCLVGQRKWEVTSENIQVKVKFALYA